MSENFAYSHSSQQGQAKSGHVGVACPQVTCKIGDKGEVLVRSPANMQGYYKDAELTAQAFDADGFLRTGDKGEIDAQGRLKITGRIKEIFKTSKGKYVAPAPIEDLLLSNTDLEQVCVTGVALAQPIALATLSESARQAMSDSRFKQKLSESLDKLLHSTNARLDKHENLSTLIILPEPWTVENNLMTPTLKIKRTQVEGAFEAEFQQWCGDARSIIWTEMRLPTQSS